MFVYVVYYLCCCLGVLILFTLGGDLRGCLGLLCLFLSVFVLGMWLFQVVGLVFSCLICLHVVLVVVIVCHYG